MLDFVLVGKGALVAATVAGATLLSIIMPVRMPSQWRLRTGFVLAVGAGIYAGCGVLDRWPRWPAPEDRDRFLVVLLPLAIAVEVGAALRAAGWLRWSLRAGLAAVAAPVLLYNSVYLADLSGPGSAEWTTAEAAAILLGLAISFVAVWGLLAGLQSRSPGLALSPVLTLVALACSITVMLSGYYYGGLLGLPVASALAGAALASCAARSAARADANLGISLVGIFTVLVIGRFFGSLPTSTAVCLGFAPLLAWIVETPPLRKLGPRIRTVLCCILVALPLIVIVARAQTKFNEAFQHRFAP